MNNEIRIYGASDDLVEVEGATREEFSAYGDDRWLGVLASPSGEQLLLTAEYTGRGTWAIGVAPVDEDIPMPSWPISVGQAMENRYSAMLTITVPDGVTLTDTRDRD